MFECRLPSMLVKSVLVVDLNYINRSKVITLLFGLNCYKTIVFKEGCIGFKKDIRFIQIQNNIL